MGKEASCSLWGWGQEGGWGCPWGYDFPVALKQLSSMCLGRRDVFGKIGCLERSDEAQAQGEHPALLPAIQSCLRAARSPVWVQKNQSITPRKAALSFSLDGTSRPGRACSPGAGSSPPGGGLSPPGASLGQQQWAAGVLVAQGAAGAWHSPAPSRRVS